MAKSNFRRTLAAVVYTDIVGYSAVMQKDEAQAKLLRDRHREVFDKLTPAYNGKILQYYGDGTLSIFDSAVDAVECAVKMQLEFQQTPQVPLRIGIHLGDIAFDDQEAFGDGMNIASRIERVCTPKSIFLSQKVNDEIKNHSWVKTKHLGTFNFKNIHSDIDLYAVSNEGLVVPEKNYLSQLNFAHNKARRKSTPILSHWMSIAAVLVIALGSNYIYHLINPDNPVIEIPTNENMSIAVLPFTNFNGEGENDYLSDGITEDILTMLSQIEGLDVVSRTSVMQYKNTTKPIPKIARELGANHILEGSVRKSGNKIRVVAQLIDAKKDAHIWANTYDSEFTEIFEVQSQVAENIATALKSQLTDSEKELLALHPTQDVNAYEFYLKGRNHYRKYTDENNDEAIAYFHKALKIDKDFALAYAGLGDALAQKAFRNNMNQVLIDSAVLVSKRAIELKPGLSEGYKSLGLSYQYQDKLDKALEAYETAMKFDSKNDMAASNISSIYYIQGDFAKSIDWSIRAININPSYPMAIVNLASKYHKLSMDEEVTALCNDGITLHPNVEEFYALLADVALANQDFELVHTYAKKVLELNPENIEGVMLNAYAYYLKRDFDNAKIAAQKVVDYADKYKDYHLSKQYAKGALAHIDILEGNKKKGETVIKKLLKEIEKKASHPKKEVYYNNLKYFLYGILGNEQEAIKLLKKISAKDFIDIRLHNANPAFDKLNRNTIIQQILQENEQFQDSIRQLVTKKKTSIL